MNELLRYMNPLPQTLTGKVTAFQPNNQPILVQLERNSSYWVAVYDSPEPLEEWLKANNIKNYKLKKIDDGVEFIACLEAQNVRIMLNPHIVMTPKGPKTRWTEIMSEKKAENKFPIESN